MQKPHNNINNIASWSVFHPVGVIMIALAIEIQILPDQKRLVALGLSLRDVITALTITIAFGLSFSLLAIISAKLLFVVGSIKLSVTFICS